MEIAIKAIMYGGVDSIPPGELTPRERQKIKQYRYEIRQELETAKSNNEAGDIFREPNSSSSNNSRVVSVRTTRSIKPLVANFVNGVHEDEQCIIH